MSKTRRSTRRVSRRKIRKGGAEMVTFKVTWFVDGKEQRNIFDRLYEISVNNYDDVADATDYVDGMFDRARSHVESKNYTNVKWPGSNGNPEDEFNFNSITADWDGQGPPPDIDDFTNGVGEIVAVSAKFTKPPSIPILASAAAAGGKKKTGGAPQRVKLAMSWNVGDSGKFLKYAKSKNADLADMVDDIELHVGNSGYKYVQIPLYKDEAENPKTLNAVYATWEEPGAPPTPKPLTITDPEATATFSVSADSGELKHQSGGKKKTRRRA